MGTTKPKRNFFFAALTALWAQHRVNQNKQNRQTFCEEFKFLIDCREVLTKLITKIVDVDGWKNYDGGCLSTGSCEIPKSTWSEGGMVDDRAGM